MISRTVYHEFEPHRAHPNAVLEDVLIGRYLHARGVVPYLIDATNIVQVDMYRSFVDAWRGFRKNAYLLMTGRPFSFGLLSAGFAVAYVWLPYVMPGFILALFGLKAATDYISRVPWWTALLTPISFVLAVILQWDSAIHHRTSRVEWKGRRV